MQLKTKLGPPTADPAILAFLGKILETHARGVAKYRNRCHCFLLAEFFVSYHRGFSL